MLCLHRTESADVHILGDAARIPNPIKLTLFPDAPAATIPAASASARSLMVDVGGTIARTHARRFSQRTRAFAAGDAETNPTKR